MLSGIVVLADPAARIGAGGVEVAQGHVLEAVGHFEILEHLLDHELGRAVGAHGPGGMILGQRHAFRRTVGGAGARKDEARTAVAAHGRQQRQRPGHVVAVVLLRIGHGFAHVGEGGEMQHRLGLVFLERLVQIVAVQDIPTQKRSPFDRPVMAVDHVVQGHRRVAGRPERLAGVGADVARPARYQNVLAHARVPCGCRSRKFGSEEASADAGNKDASGGRGGASPPDPLDGGIWGLA